MGVRQPLASVSFGVSSSRERTIVEQYDDLIRDELNVKSIKFLSDSDGITTYKLSPVFAKLGAKLKGDMQAVKSVLTSADKAQTAAWGRALMNNEAIHVSVGDKKFELLPEEVEVRQEASEGFIVFEERGYVAALDVTLTPELVNERMAREIVRRIQTLRKDAGLELADRIAVCYQASDKLQDAIRAFGDYIRKETLALELQNAQPDATFTVEDFTESLKGELDGETLTVGLKRIS
jgi:isoleucyl-tRNA synthetase